MNSILGAIGYYAYERSDMPAIEDGAGLSLDWATLARLLLQIAKDVAERFDAHQPIAIRADYGVARCLLELVLLDLDLPVIAIPVFFNAEQVGRTLEAAGCAVLVTEITLERGASPRLRLATETTPQRTVTLPPGTAIISFTSGSTDNPKGVCLSADHVAAVAATVVSYLGEEYAGRHLPLLPPGILLESVAGFYASMLAGGSYVALPQAAVGLANPFRPDFALMADAIDTHAITSLILVPEYLAGLVGALEASGRRLPRLT
uniref:AMP-binding protein n=1 Tax=uncultured Sphingomonas sp. TaxID=158754 RepID=UPI0035CC252C